MIMKVKKKKKNYNLTGILTMENKIARQPNKKARGL